MNEYSQIKHLTREDIIKNGSIFTPDILVNLVFDYVSPYINSKSVIGDFGCGYGAFINIFRKLNLPCFGTEMDNLSYKFLLNEFPTIKFYHENSLININRKKYNLKYSDELIIIGNPPYNDTTSIFKKSNKGNIIADNDVLSRDLGVSFLKAYDKLEAKIICVLHPLSYLIKKRNFTSLGNFNNNYKLINATIFSSKLFQSITKSNSDFPVVAALYEKSSEGMNYEYIQNFSFNILNSDKKFILNKIQTIDGHIQKYPIKNNTNDGLKFYTIRDINALLRNTSFLEGNVPNGIDVTIDNLYHYAWLYFFKTNYKKTNNHFLYGNLTPFYTSKIEDAEFKLALVSYAYNNNILIKKYFSKDKIKISYGEIHSSYDILFEEFSKIYVFN